MHPDLKSLDINALQRLGEQVLQEIVKRAKNETKKSLDEERSSTAVASSSNIRPTPSKASVTELIHTRENHGTESVFDKDIDGCQYVGNDISPEFITRNNRTLSVGAVRYLKVSKVFFQADLTAMDPNMMELVNGSCVTGEVIQRNTDSVVMKILGLPIKLKLNFTRVKECVRSMEHNLADCSVWFTENLLRDMSVSSLMADRLKFNTLICLLTESPCYLSDSDWHHIDRVRLHSHFDSSHDATNGSSSSTLSYMDIEALPSSEVYRSRRLGPSETTVGHTSSSSSSSAAIAATAAVKATVTPEPSSHSRGRAAVAQVSNGSNNNRGGGSRSSSSGFAPFDHQIIVNSLSRGSAPKEEVPEVKDQRSRRRVPLKTEDTVVAVISSNKRSTTVASSRSAAAKEGEMKVLPIAEGYSTRSGRSLVTPPPTGAVSASRKSGSKKSGSKKSSSKKRKSEPRGGGSSIKVSGGKNSRDHAAVSSTSSGSTSGAKAAVGAVGAAPIGRVGSNSWIEWQNEDIYGKKYSQRDRSVSVMDRMTRIDFPSKGGMKRQRRDSSDDEEEEEGEGDSSEGSEDSGSRSSGDDNDDGSESESELESVDGEDQTNGAVRKSDDSALDDKEKQKSGGIGGGGGGMVAVFTSEGKEEGDDHSLVSVDDEEVKVDNTV